MNRTLSSSKSRSSRALGFLGWGLGTASLLGLGASLVGCSDGATAGGADGRTGGIGSTREALLSYCGAPMDQLAVCGRVMSTDGQLLGGAAVKLDDATVTTAADGTFKISRTLGGTHMLSIQQDGYMPLVMILASSIPDRSFSLAPLHEVTFAMPGALIDVTDPITGAHVSVAPADLIDENGQAAVPPLILGVRYIDPAVEPMPGDDGAFDLANNPVYLKSFGAMYIGARTASRQRLTLKAGAHASVIIPITADRLGVAPPAIPVWGFDIDQGVWRQQPGSGLTNTPKVAAPKGVGRCKNQAADGCAVRCSDLSKSGWVGQTSTIGFVNADASQGQPPACLWIEIDGNAVAPNDLPLCMEIVGPAGSPALQARYSCFNAGTSVFYNLPPNADMTIAPLSGPGCSSAPGASTVTVNTGAPWGGTGSPPSASLCHGFLSIPPLP